MYGRDEASQDETEDNRIEFLDAWTDVRDEFWLDRAVWKGMATGYNDM